MSIWQNCRTAVIFKSILSPHATCELKRMCFPKEIWWLVLCDRFLNHSWNFVSVATWLTCQQQFCRTKDAEYPRSGYGNDQSGHAIPFGLWGSFQADCPTYNQRKEILTHWEDPVGLFPLLLFAGFAGYEGQESDSGDCLHEYVQLVTGFGTQVRVKEGLQFCSRGWYLVCGGDCVCL